ncbi:hypothetical protein [Anabaena sp. PCC 7108]|uniref:hypothetical protein n=1 Tax=Anabaena sp. PCC 7108 TaxID=163908 RepID=UPI000366463A|nr:hypothetical protein [Anabaena sp. PCC 7108]
MNNKKLMIFSTTNLQKVFTITGIVMLTSSVYLGDDQAQSLANSRSLSRKAEGRGATAVLGSPQVKQVAWQEAGGKRIVEIPARLLGSKGLGTPLLRELPAGYESSAASFSVGVESPTEKAHKASCLLPPASCLLPRLLIAQNLGGIVRKIPLEEVALPAMSSAKTATNAKFSQARIELKSDGSLIYILRGQNQQGFEVEVQVTPIGTLIQVDEQIESSGVPETAVKAFKKWAPNDPLISTWRSTRLGEFFYQFVIRDFWLEIAADGNRVLIYRKKINI